MEYETFLYTRNLIEDYCWHKRPNLLNGGFYKFFTPLIELRECLNGINIDWSQIFFMIRYDGTNIACRILSDVGEDYVGRPIYSLEGVVSNDKMNRSNYSIPDLLAHLYDNLDGYAVLETESKLPSGFEVEDNINPLIGITEDNTIDVEEDRLINNIAFQNLVKDIGIGNTGYVFLIGPGAEIIYEMMKKNGTEKILGCEKYYDLNNDKKNIVISDRSGCSYECINITKKLTNEEGKRATLCIQLHKEGRNVGSYEWFLQKKGGENWLKTKKHKFDHRVSIEKLYKEATRIKNYYTLLGYDID